MESPPFARRFSSALLRCGLAVALVAAALTLSLFLQSVVPTAGYVFFYAAIVASTWFAGRVPGAIAVALSTLAADYFFMLPIHTFELNRESVPILIEFAASSALVGWFSSWRRQAESALEAARDQLQARVEERTAELKRTNEQLLAEMVERKRAEGSYYEAQAELARVTRMSAMGALAASISHEVNQPLAAVVTNADACMMWLSSEPPNLEEVRAAVDSIAREGTRASDVVRHIRAMFTKAAPERTALHVNELIRDVEALMQPQASRNQTAIRTDLGAGLPPTVVDRVQLQQVMVNLVLNGIEAMSAITGRPRLLEIQSTMHNSDEVLVVVRDSGVGIAPKDQKRLFDAFFTTKDQGMGMGLSISHSIIEAHGGRLWASANSDHGATFQFTLPVGREGTS